MELSSVVQNCLRNKIILFTAGILCLCSFHPFYVNVTDIKYDQKSKSLQISCRTFTDDLEKALEKSNGASIDLLHPKEKDLADKWVNAYILKNLKIRINGKMQTIHYIGYEQEEEAIWSYFEINNISSPSNINIESTILYDVEETQMGIVHIDINGNKQSSKVINPDKRLSFVFK